jgi:hypothetical protein
MRSDRVHRASRLRQTEAMAGGFTEDNYSDFGGTPTLAATAHRRSGLKVRERLITGVLSRPRTPGKGAPSVVDDRACAPKPRTLLSKLLSD